MGFHGYLTNSSSSDGATHEKLHESWNIVGYGVIRCIGNRICHDGSSPEMSFMHCWLGDVACWCTQNPWV